jgi:hypothetical protein
VHSAAPNLVHDTTYRRLRRRVARSVQHVDDAIRRTVRRRIRVLFEAASPMSMSVFRPMLVRLRRDPRLEFWFTTCDGSWDAEAIFGRLGIHDRVVTPGAARWMKFDVYINTDFWDMTWLPRRPLRLHLFHGVAGKYGLDAPVRIAPIVAAFDRILFPNEDRRRRYADAGLVDAASPQAALIGYPKVDCLVDGTLNREVIGRALGLDRRRPTVLYAPTWSPYSSLNRCGKAIIDCLSRLDVNVVVKLHDRSYDSAARASGGIDWRRDLEPFCRERRAHLASDADASPYLFAADVLLTDHSSVGFEYMLLDRPIVVVDCPELIEKARINPQKVALMHRASHVVPPDGGAAAEAAVQALAQPHLHGAARRATAGELFYRAGGATTRAVQCFYDLLSLEAPASAGEEHATDLPPAFAPFEARTT